MNSTSLESKIILGDCLEEMRKFPDNYFDLVLTDPPYGMTSNEWDIVVDFIEGALRVAPLLIMTASQPYSSLVIAEYRSYFKHEWIWVKNAGSNFANTVREPMKEHEQVIVFCTSTKWTYNKQMQKRTSSGEARVKTPVKFETRSANYKQFERVETKEMPNLRVPSSVQKFNRERGLHPTQKPLKLMEYLVKTYSNEGDNILDPFCGSGTTLLAAKNLKRGYIGMERDKRYFDISNDRLK